MREPSKFWETVFCEKTYFKVSPGITTLELANFRFAREPNQLAEEMIENLEAGLNSFRATLKSLNKVA